MDYTILVSGKPVTLLALLLDRAVEVPPEASGGRLHYRFDHVQTLGHVGGAIQVVEDLKLLAFAPDKKLFARRRSDLERVAGAIGGARLDSGDVAVVGDGEATVSGAAKAAMV